VNFEFVMPGLVPGIHVLLCVPRPLRAKTYACQGVDGRDKPGHDAERKRVTQISAGRRQPDAIFLQCDSVSETWRRSVLQRKIPENARLLRDFAASARETHRYPNDSA
jgi:hypothetical protein